MQNETKWKSLRENCEILKWTLFARVEIFEWNNENFSTEKFIH